MKRKNKKADEIADQKLAEMENATADLISLMSSERKFEDAGNLSALAKQIQMTRRHIQLYREVNFSSPPSSSSTSRHSKRAPQKSLADLDTETEKQSMHDVRQTGDLVKSSTVEYFRRDPDLLLKVGHSKKSDKTYRHPLEYKKVEAILRAAVELQNKPFSAKDLEHSKFGTNAHAGAYGVYVALQWFQDRNWLKKTDRRGLYSLESDLPWSELKEALQAKFKELLPENLGSLKWK